MVTRLTQSQVPLVRAAILSKRQDGKCPLCNTPLTVKTGCLDHDHTTGHIRGVLCRNCNGIEGKIKNLVTRGRRGAPHTEYLGRLILYWRHHELNPTGLFYPTHKTADEKRLAANAKARKKRAASKATRTKVKK